MSETPTARELLTELDHKHWHPGPINDLASRVEAVLALLKKYRTIPADLIERILDGGKP